MIPIFQNKFWVTLLSLSLIGLIGSIAHPSDPTPPVIPEDTAAEAFDQMMSVISHKRCVNCHPSGDRPHQGEDSHPHRFGVERGEDGHGVAALQCGTCHQESNNLSSGVPGAPHWHLAPRSMGWEGLSKIEIAESMLNPNKNGGRTVAEIEKHLTEDLLVLWVFEPGIDHEGVAREKPPISKEAYIEAVKTWVAAGAVVPAE
ncbi:MAG: hypothetical protein AAF399_02900 [Bacteroidota bacterium]